MSAQFRSSLSWAAFESLRILAEVPYFDEALAVALLKSEEGPTKGRASAHGVALQTISTISSYGGLERIKGLFRVPPAVQTIMMVEGARANLIKRQNAAGLFVDHAKNSLQEPLYRVLGTRGRDLVVSCFDVIARPDKNDALDVLALGLFSARDYGRLPDIEAARHALRERVARDHPIFSLIEGLELWNRGKQLKSATALRRLARTEQKHAMGGIANHLLGVFESDRRRWKPSEVHLKAAVETFRAIEDPVGLSRALCSTARMQFERGMRIGNYEGIVASLDLLDRAKQVCDSIPAWKSVERAQSLGRIQIVLSRSHSELGFTAEALDAAHSAVWLLESFDSESLWARENLAGVLRAAGRNHDAKSVLNSSLHHLPPGVEGMKASVAAILELVSIPAERGYSEATEALVSRGIELATRMDLPLELAQLRLARARIGLTSIEHSIAPEAWSSIRQDLRHSSEIARTLGKDARFIDGEVLRELARLQVLASRHESRGSAKRRESPRTGLDG